MGGSLKNPIFREGGGVERGSRKTNKNGNSLKRFADLRGGGVGLGKKEGGTFMRGGWYPNAHCVTRLHAIYLFFKQNPIFEKKKFVRKELPKSTCSPLVE